MRAQVQSDPLGPSRRSPEIGPEKRASPPAGRAAPCSLMVCGHRAPWSAEAPLRPVFRMVFSLGRLPGEKTGFFILCFYPDCVQSTVSTVTPFSAKYWAAPFANGTAMPSVAKS